MSMQGLHQVQKQTQTLVLAPQLRQSLKILQVPALELRNAILEELQTNPTLEELPIEGIRIEKETPESDASDQDSGESKEMEFDENFQILHQLDEDWRDHFSQESRNNVYSTDAAEKRQHFFDSLTSDTSLQEHLIRQAELTEATAEELKAIEFLVGSLDDRGFLTASISDVALLCELPLKTVQSAQEILQTLDPPGIASPDLRSCLLIQLKLKQRSNSMAAIILRDHFDLLLRRRILDIARKMKASAEDVQQAIEEIATLDPSPGRKYNDDTNRVVVPDVIVVKDDGEWTITLNNDYIPRLRLSSIYKSLIARGQVTKKEKEYIQEKLRSGKFLINSIEQRQQTVERITREILKFQGEFFEEGVSKLKPLTMHEVADEVGVHETTVSRAIANKYIETPHGVFELKYFFTSGYTSGGGESVSNTSVKDTINRLIESENTMKPLSDQAIADILKEKGIKIARRTVAKYREELGILPTNLRRQY